MITTLGWIFIILFAIPSLCGLWNVFEKCGEEGWKAIVPIYNIYTLCKVFYNTAWFWYYLLINILTAIFVAMCVPDVFVLIPFIAIVLSLFSIWVLFMIYYRVSIAFGYGAMFTLGLFFLYPIFILYLGYGKDKPKAEKINSYLKQNEGIQSQQINNR